MTRELNKRILTSIILVIIIWISIFVDKIITIVALASISIISWHEFTKLINKIFAKKQEIKANIILIISALYFVVFSGVAYYLIAFDKIYFIFILLTCIFSDIGGYVFGKTFKGKKLTKISPNKTISGSIGSFIFAFFPYAFLKIIFIFTKTEYFIFVDMILLNIITILYLSLVCQVGDLFISFFKRLANVKDTGNLLPGHGGLLDRIDGIIFAIPALGFLGFLFK